jgi:drug/metabolite transporter, DME family
MSDPNWKFLRRIRPDLQMSGLFAIVLAAIAWAIAANVANSLFLAGVSPLELSGVSAMIATFGLAILDSLFGRSHAQPISRQQFALGLILVGLGGADYIAIQGLPVAVAIVLLYTAPILVVLWSALSARRFPPSPVLIALIFSVTGVVLVSNVLVEGWVNSNGVSILVGLTTPILFAAYILLSENMKTADESTGVMLKTFAVASLVWGAYQFTQGMPWVLLSSNTFPKVLYIGIAGNLLPYLLFFWSTQRVEAQQAAIAATLEPAIAGVLAWIWFGQTLNWIQLVGSLLIIVAITWMQLKITNQTATQHSRPTEY